MKRNLFLQRYVFVLMLGLSVGLTSCKDDDDPTPEIVTDETAYYIVGEVVSGDRPLAGVKVSVSGQVVTTGTDGLFELKTGNKGNFDVFFSKEGYVGITAKAMIASDAKNKSSVVIKQALTPKSAPVHVAANKETEIRSETEPFSLLIPEGALMENMDITITPIIPGVQPIASSGTVSASLICLDMEPDGLTFDKPVELKLDNPMGDAVAFSNLRHVVVSNGVRKDAGEVVYDEDQGCYIAKINGFSQHSFEIAANASTDGTTTEALDTKVIDNLGNMSAKNETISVKQKYGWSIHGNLTSMLKSSYPNLPDATINALAANFTTAVSSLMGSNPGTGELNLTMPFHVSGDTKLTIEVLAQIENKSFSFPLIFENGNLDWFNVSVKQYVGTEIKTTYQYGNTHTDHSGGSGN